VIPDALSLFLSSVVSPILLTLLIHGVKVVDTFNLPFCPCGEVGIKICSVDE
jgi:hypothetical protein